MELLQAATHRQIHLRLITSREIRSASTLGDFVIEYEFKFEGARATTLTDTRRPLISSAHRPLPSRA